jgi:hypothetical protein
MDALDRALLWALVCSCAISTALCAALMLRRAAFTDDAYQLPMLIAVTATAWMRLPSREKVA